MALINKLTAIADAIRSVTGDATPLTLDDMVTEIKKLGVVVTVYGQPVADSSVLSIANGETVQFGVKLSEEPTQNQTITIISDNDLLTFDQSSLTFTTSNWNEYQYVNVAAGVVEEDVAATITLRNSDELLTDTAITVYLTADVYNVDMTMPDGAHTVTAADFDAVTVSNGKALVGVYTAEYTNIVVPANIEYEGASYPLVFKMGTFNGNTVIQYVDIEDGAIYEYYGKTSATQTKAFNSVFTGCTSLIGVKYHCSTITDMSNTFANCSSLKFVDGLDMYTSCTNLYYTFSNCTALEYLPDLRGMTAVTSGQSTFKGCTNLRKVYGVPSGFAVANSLYYQCTALETAEIPATVTNASYCFGHCTALKSVKVYADGITNANQMFQNCSGVTCYVPEGSTTYDTIFGVYGSSASVSLAYLGCSTLPCVSCWGDSTTSTGTDGEAWPARLQTILGDNLLVKNMAISGEYTTSTSCRQGGNQAKLLEAVTIPAEASAVNVTLISEDGQTFGTSPVLSTGANYNPVTIQGIKGSITVSNGQASFIRLSAGETVEVAADTPVISENSVSRKSDQAQVFYIGSNSGWNETPSTLLTQVQSMVNYYGGTNYIVVGIATGKYVRTEEKRAVVLEYEALAADAFGDHWLNLREYLIANSLTENGLSATETDESRMANGQVPWSILMGSNTENGTDDSHYNTYGLQSVCNAIYTKGQNLGYWT